MRKFARHCEGEGTGAVVGCDAKGARFRTLANLYLCEGCYRRWLEEVRHVEAAEPAASSSAAVVGTRDAEEDW